MPVIDSSLPLAPEDMSWDSGEAIKAVKDYASDDEGNINFSKYKKAFFYVADGGGDKQGDYALPFATVVDGELKAVWKGVAAAMAALNGARNADPVPDAEKEDVYHEICTYYKRFQKEPPELAKALKGKSVLKIGDRVDFMLNVDNSTLKELSDNTFSATITTSDVDRMGEVIDYAGVDTNSYMNNPVVLYGHDYSGLPIGKTLKLARSHVNKAWNATFQLASEIYPFAATVAAMIKAGYLNAVSIGGVVKAYTGDPWGEDENNPFTITQMEMVEFSIVPVPANPNALITGRSFEKAIGKSTKQIAEEYHDFVSKSVTESLEKSLDIDELDRHIKSLKDLTAILETAKTAKTSEKEISEEEDQHIKLTLRKAGGQVSETGQQIIKLVRAPKG